MVQDQKSDAFVSPLRTGPSLTRGLDLFHPNFAVQVWCHFAYRSAESKKENKKEIEQQFPHLTLFKRIKGIKPPGPLFPLEILHIVCLWDKKASLFVSVITQQLNNKSIASVQILLLFSRFKFHSVRVKLSYAASFHYCLGLRQNGEYVSLHDFKGKGSVEVF